MSLVSLGECPAPADKDAGGERISKRGRETHLTHMTHSDGSAGEHAMQDLGRDSAESEAWGYPYPRLSAGPDPGLIEASAERKPGHKESEAKTWSCPRCGRRLKVYVPCKGAWCGRCKRAAERVRGYASAV